MFLRLALRNVLRNRRRSAITVSSIAIGLAAMTFLWAMTDDMNRQMVENSTRYFAGDVQVHLKGYHDDPTLDLAMQDAAGLLATVRRHPDVSAAAARLEGKALASRGDKSRGVMLAGVVPKDEARLTILAKAIVQGVPLRADAPGVLVGEKLAQALGVRAGEELVFVGQGYDGSLASARWPVRGVFASGIDELDGYVAVAPLAQVRDFYSAPAGATAVVLRLRDRDRLEAVQASLAEEVGVRYEVLGWPRLLPLVAVSWRFHVVVASVVLLVFFVVVGAAVANPVLMAVLERTREFGIMLALGMSRARLLTLVIVESMMLGVAGVLAGNVLGLAVTLYFGRVGIDFGAFEQGMRVMPGLSNFIHPMASVERSLMLSALVFVIACVSAIYPAAKAAGLQPVEAIRGLGRGAMGAARGTGALHLPLFLLIAARNLLRNPRRTVIMVSGAAFGIVGYVFLLSFFDGFYDGMIDNATRYMTGHVQVEREGFRREFAPELAIAEPAALLARLRAAPGISAAAPRVQAQALASTAAQSEGIMLVGVEPSAERAVTFIDRTVVAGRALAPGADHEVMIGRKLADRLKLRPGEKMVVMAQAANGELGTAAFRVAGIFATESSTFDGAFAFVTLGAAQSLLALEGRISTVNLRLDERARTLPMTRTLREQLAARGLAVAPWQELLPQLDDMARISRVFTNILLALLLLVVTTAVMNTVFMAVTERTHEFGVMVALGTAPAAILRMVVYETVVLLVAAAAVGYGIGSGVVLWSGEAGIDLSGFFRGYSAIPGLTGVVYPQLVMATVVPPGIALVVLGVLVSLYPAAKAARLDPSLAIRHV